MSFKINDTTLETIIERVQYEVIRLIPSLTGPTGPIANVGVLLEDGTLIKDIIPDENSIYSLGTPSLEFSNIYSRTVYINGIPITSDGNIIELPAGTLIGGVTIGTIKILGEKSSPAQLPTPATVGDAYIISDNLWVYTSYLSWTNIGKIAGPRTSRSDGSNRSYRSNRSNRSNRIYGSCRTNRSNRNYRTKRSNWNIISNYRNNRIR